MNLIAITPPYFYEGEAGAITNALGRGFSRVHIRKPESSREEMTRLLTAIPNELRHKISLHDHHDLAKQFGIGGIHLNKRNPLMPDGWQGILSASAHSPVEAKRLMSDFGDRLNYLFLSPVFPSLSKPGYMPKFSYDEFASVAGPKVYALGGVTTDKLQLLEKTGFGGSALLTDAWRKPFDMDAFRLQFITHPSADRDLVEGARLALKGGCLWIQLRHKEASQETLIREGMEIGCLCREYNAVFIIDDHVELVGRLNADGVHLGQNDMPVGEARRILGPGKIIGATANTYEQFEKAAKDGADYAGIGPFRFTTTKKNLSPVLGIDGYHRIIEQKRATGIRIPIVAIGGITPDDIPAIMATGVEGIAASGTILTSPDPITTTQNIINKFSNP